MCDPILLTLLIMRPHYSQSSRENATPSSGTSPLVSYKEVPPIPPRGNSYIKVTGVLFVSLMSENCSFWLLFLSGQKANIQLNLHTATFLQRPICGRNSIHWLLFRPLYNGHFLLSPRSPFYLLAKVANWSQVSLHCWKSGIWSSLIIWLVTKYHWAYFHLKSTLFLRQYEQQLNPRQIIIYKRLTEINSSYYGLSC